MKKKLLGLLLSLPTLCFAMNENYDLGYPNCADPGQFPTLQAHCDCIMNNSIAQCMERSPIKASCNADFLRNIFKNNPNFAIPNCQQFSPNPAECAPTIMFYNQHC